jgi:hypothetical protein
MCEQRDELEKSRSGAALRMTIRKARIEWDGATNDAARGVGKNGR